MTEPSELNPTKQRVITLTIELLLKVTGASENHGESGTDLTRWIATMEEHEHPGITELVLNQVLYTVGGIMLVAADATGRPPTEILSEGSRRVRELLDGPT